MSVYKQIILENKLKDSLVNQIETNGVMSVLKITRFTFTKLVSIIGLDWVNRKIMIKFIKDFVDDGGWGFGLSEIDKDPIFYDSNNEEYREITYIGKTRVTVDVYSDDFSEHLGEFSIEYEALSDKILTEIFDTLINIYEVN
jgi:hypothetical protein